MQSRHQIHDSSVPCGCGATVLLSAPPSCAPLTVLVWRAGGGRVVAAKGRGGSGVLETMRTPRYSTFKLTWVDEAILSPRSQSYVTSPNYIFKPQTESRRPC